MSNNNLTFTEKTYSRKVIYAYEMNYGSEKGYIKVGETSIDKPNEDLRDNSEYLRSIAEKRIREYDRSSQINILYATVAIKNDFIGFRDHQVHEVLKRAGINRVKRGEVTEWFKTDLDTVLNAINAVKEGKSYINGLKLNDSNEKIIFRPEQEQAIKDTLKVLKNNDAMLWNAKMRFGKTLSALEVVKRAGFNRTLILTHRPIVDRGWSDDFKKIFNDSDDYIYGSKHTGEKIENLEKVKNNKFIYFVSMQDLRGSSKINNENGFDKNEEIFNINWDFIIIDEAHEGTQTTLAQRVMDELNSDKTKVLKLSGTPFNLLDDFDETEIYTWDYVMEQQAKHNWDIENPGSINPYSSLPEMNMFVYELADEFRQELFVDEETRSFNFAEFFKVENDKFVYEKDIWSYLNLISRSEDYSSSKTNMPFSTEEYRNELRHTLWTLPSRNATVALEKLLHKHPVFKFFNIANLTEDGNSSPDLEKIRKAITDEPEDSFSITLTVRKGTVGITVKEWTGILVLNNTESASNYLQSIFRVQSPYLGKNGQKEKAYVFDFAPDRSLKMISSVANLNIKSGTLNSIEQEQNMSRLLNFFPIIGISGNSMKKFDVKKMLTQLKRAQADRAVRNGFDDSSIYNDELLKLNDVDISEFENLKKIIGSTKQSNKINDIDINNQGLTEEEWEKAEKARKKPTKDRTPEEQAALEKKKQLSTQRQTMISILRGISIRIPLMIYGMDMDINDDVTLSNFTSKIDDISWLEFMPKGVTKTEFDKFKKYYDSDIFIEAGRRIRRSALSADKLAVEDRIKKVTSILSGFKNPDKETVLTPWRVVNMHLGETLGGYNFFDNDYPNTPNDNQNIRFIDKGQVTETVFNKDSKILEINSKSGLYPLYMAYTIYKKRLINEQVNWSKEDYIHSNNKLWQEVLQNNIYVLNKTSMARTITYRTLNGYKKNKKVYDNLIYIDNLTTKIKDNLEETKNEIINKLGGIELKFDAVVGNPPYHEILSSDTGKAKQLFPHYIMGAIKFNVRYISLITPARWYAGRGQDGSFITLRNFIRTNNHIKSITFHPDEKEIFNNVQIKGGINYFLFDSNYVGQVEFTIKKGENSTCLVRDLFIDGVEEIITDEIKISIIEKIRKQTNEFITEITTGRDAFGISGKQEYVDKLVSEIDSGTVVSLRCMKGVVVKINQQYVNKNLDIMKNFKVFVSKSAGDPKTDRNIIGKPFLARPGEVCTDTFIPIGNFDREVQAINLVKYLNTKFSRYLISILKTSQNVSQNVYKFIPLFNFDENDSIDWNVSLDEIDEQLFRLYSLNSNEISEINNSIEGRNI